MLEGTENDLGQLRPARLRATCIERGMMANDNTAARPSLPGNKPPASVPRPVSVPITSYRVQAILTLFR